MMTSWMEAPELPQPAIATADIDTAASSTALVAGRTLDSMLEQQQQRQRDRSGSRLSKGSAEATARSG
jgi:hypothetical protein